jgi:Ser/Thr protein kinase RdoA (MazF antagonist)
VLRTLSDALRPQALLEFELPAAPQRIEELAAPQSGGEAMRVHAPAGDMLLLLSTDGPLTLAFEATLFELLAGARYPAAKPRRTRTGSLLAQLHGPTGPAAATCYVWPPGDPVRPEGASEPQQLEAGRLLARLHLLGSAHPASVPDPLDGAQLAARLPAGGPGEELRDVLQPGLPGLPAGAVHGCFGPSQLLFAGERATAVLPSGISCSAPLVVDLAHALCAWALPLPRPQLGVRAIVSGYQALRRLAGEERDALYPALRFAAARAGALLLLSGRVALALAALRACEALGEADVRAAAG